MYVTDLPALLVEALAWPIVVGVGFWSVRGQVGGLVGRIRRLKWKDAEAAFSEQLDKIEEKAPPPPAIEAPTNVQERVVEAQLPPGYIVQQAWLRLQQAIQEAANFDLSSDERWLLSQLRLLKNEALQSPQGITVTDALRFKDQAEDLARRIRGRRAA
jgi:hypothetical protein